MILECTDCENCISYGFGFRIACGHPSLPADEVYKYLPVGDKDAMRCSEFVDDNPRVELPEADIDKAVELYGDDVSSLRKYAEARVASPPQEE